MDTDNMGTAEVIMEVVDIKDRRVWAPGWGWEDLEG